MKYNTNSLIIYEGISLIDNKTPIVCILTGLNNASANSKTGDMLQTWILRQDIPPHTAVKNGLDSAICGDCKFSGGNGCYVNVSRAPNNIWKSYKNNRYRYFEPRDLKRLKGRSLRIGSYGEGTAIPYIIWYNMLKHVEGYTGYTHQASKLDPKWQFLMASADTPLEQSTLQSKGWRTFTTISDLEMMNSSDIICPATKEGGLKTNCSACRLCSGNRTKAKSISVVLHGASHTVKKAKISRENAILLESVE